MHEHVTVPALAAVAAVGSAAASTIMAVVDVQVDAGLVTAISTAVLAMAAAVAKMWRSQMAQASELGRLEAAVEACRARDVEHRAERDEWRRERDALRQQIAAVVASLARDQGDGR
jgi:hypothetical protein